VKKDPKPVQLGLEEEIQRPSLAVEEFLNKNRDKLSLGISSTSRAMKRLITKKRLQKLGMALAGFTDYLREGRIYVFGNTEARFFQKQLPQSRRKILESLMPEKLSCILATQGLKIPSELSEFVMAREIPVLQTQLDSSSAIYQFSEFLEMELSPRVIIHGVLMDVFGVGALLVGESGIGKSECALELVLKGHRIVADDTVDIRCVGKKQLIGSVPPALQDILELRGIGIVNIRELFGISAIRLTKDVNFIIELQKWEPQTEYDRLGLEIMTRDLLGFNVPYITIPVAPGRNLAILVEIACRVYLMRNYGLNPMGKFAQHLNTDSNELTDVDEGGEQQ